MEVSAALVSVWEASAAFVDEGAVVSPFDDGATFPSELGVDWLDEGATFPFDLGVG